MQMGMPSAPVKKTIEYPVIRKIPKKPKLESLSIQV